MLTYYFDQRDRRRARGEDRAEAERLRREERAEAERVRREERAEAERRHHEMMTALIALLERNGHASSDQSELIGQLQRRIADLEAENARLKNDSGENPSHAPASG